MAVAGDQWPIFLYHGYCYDSEDPWNGLFRSTILVSVSLDVQHLLTVILNTILILRHTSIYLHPRVPLRKSLRPLDPATRVYMA